MDRNIARMPGTFRILSSIFEKDVASHVSNRYGHEHFLWKVY